MIYSYRTSKIRRQTSQDRRAALRAAQRCINGPLAGDVGYRGVVHGPVVKGGKCQHCVDVARGKAVAA